MSFLQDLLGKDYKEGMTEEEISAALESHQNDTLSAKESEIATLKAQMQKANSEAAKYKNELKSYKSEDQQKKEEQESELATLRETVETLQKEKKVSELKANYLSMGYSEELATDTANALAEGDIAKVFANQKQFNTELENSVKANLIKGVPAPTGGTGGSTLTRDDIRKMSDKEKMALYETNREAYEAAYRGE